MVVDHKIHTRRIPLNLKVESIFQGEFCCIPNEVILGSDVEQYFSNCLFSDTKFGLDNDYDSDTFAGCTCGENPCICNHDNEYNSDSDRFAGCTCGENPCICNHDNE